MPTVIPPVPTEFLHLAPELVLALLGLFVLIYDVAVIRDRPSAARCRFLGTISVLGALLALVATFSPDLFEIRAGAGAASPTHATIVEESLFQATVLGSPLVERLNALIVILLIFVLGLSMTWPYTEHWGEYYALTIWAAVGMMLLIASED